MKWFKGRVSVFGGREVDAAIYDEAVKLGMALAEEGYLVYCGGGNGVMEAVAKGVSRGKGVCVGILKGETDTEANEFINIPVATGVGVGRNVMLAYNCDIAVAVSGSFGTLSEISYTLSMDKKVIGLHSWDIPSVLHAGDYRDVMKLLREHFDQQT